MNEDGFPTRQLCDVGVSLYDCEHKTPPDEHEGNPYLAIPNIRDGRLDLTKVRRISDDQLKLWNRRVTPSEGDIVLTRRGRVGDSARIPPGLKCAIGQNLVILRSEGPGIDQEYLRWAVRGPAWRDEVQRMLNVGAVFDSLNCSDIPKMVIPVPPIGEQRAIAQLLATFEDKIESNKRITELLEEEGRLEFAMRFNVEPRETGILLTDLVDINPTRRLQRGNRAPYVDMASIPTANALIKSAQERPFGSGQRFINGDVLMARITPCLENGKTAFVDVLTDGETGWGSTEFFVLRSKPPLPPEWAYYLARSDAFVEFAIRNMSGTSGRQRCPASAFDRLRIEEPNTGDLSAFETVARIDFAKMGAARDETLVLESLRDALLPELLSGRLRLQIAESIAETAV